ncbi:MAG: Transposase, partial [Mycobacterium sp.]|nr:Transposase [Mycobacterium sp.]
MSTDYDGRQYVGIDLHRRRSVIVRMTPEGEQLGWVRIDNDPVALGLELAKAGPDPEVVLEATYGWYWAVDALQAGGARVHLAHPLGVKGFAYRRVKNDVRDAADLCDLLRMGRLPEAYIASPGERELRELVRHRAKLVALRAGLKAQVHGVLAKQGLLPEVSDVFGQAGMAWLRTAPLDLVYRQRLLSLLELIDAYDGEIELFRAMIANRFTGHRGYRVIQQISGIGPTFAAIFIAEIGDIGRFARPEKLTCWAG